MKKALLFLSIIAAPWYLSAQSMIIGNGASVTIGVGASLETVPITNNSGATGEGLLIKSNANGTGSLISAAGASPTATVETYVTNGRWYLVSLPVKTSTGQTFFDANSSDSWLTKFVEPLGTNSASAGTGWQYITKLDSTLKNTSGFSYWSSADETISFKGDLQTGNVTADLSYTDADHGYNLIGNPFSSALHWGSGWSFNTVEKTIWIWDGSQYIAKAYDTQPYDIPMGQGFFMRSTGGNSITLPADQRVTSSQKLLKDSKLSTDASFNYLLIVAQNNQYQDRVFIYFDQAGTDGFDNGYDATKMFGLTKAPQLYLVENGKKQTNDFLPSIKEGEKRTVAMSYIPGAAGNQKLIADFSHYLGKDVILEDLKTGKTQNLKNNNTYIFTGSKADAPNRFLLHFAQGVNGIGKFAKQSENIHIYSYNKDIYIRSSKEAVSQNGEVFVYDLMGRKLVQKNIAKGEVVKLNINTRSNYVIVKVIKQGFVKTEKVFLK